MGRKTQIRPRLITPLSLFKLTDLVHIKDESFNDEYYLSIWKSNNCYYSVKLKIETKELII